MMNNRFFISSLVVIGLLTIAFSSVVDAGFPSDFFGYRFNEEGSENEFEGSQRFGKFQYNGSYGGRPDNISVCFDVVTASTFRFACAIYDMSGNPKAWTEHITFTSSSFDTFIRFDVNYTTNTTPLVPNAYYYIGIWSTTQGGITNCQVKYADSYGSQLGFYSRSDTGQFAWDSGISLTTIDADATMCAFVNYTELANPLPPENFNVIKVYASDTSLSMSWTKGTYADKTRIQRNSNGTYPENAWEGTNVYNDTGTSYIDTGLTSNAIYHYSAFSWSNTFKSYSLTYAFDNERVYVRPIKPSDLIGNNVSYTRNLFAWIKGTNATVTRIQYNVNTTYPTTVSTGTNTYNSTNTYNDDSGLLKNSSYYYSAWSFNSTNGLWSSDYATLKINTNDTIYGSVGGCDNASLEIVNNTQFTTGKYETFYSDITGWIIWLNYTGILPTFNHYENIIDATGTHEYNTQNNGYTINSWANYTGTGGGCSGIVWVNYTDMNLSFNVSVNKTDDSNTSTYALNEDNVLVIAGFSLDEDALGLFIIFALFSLALVVKDDNLVWKPILLFLDVPICLAMGVYYLGLGGWFSVNWWVGVCLFCFAILLSMGGLYYGLSFGRNQRR